MDVLDATEFKERLKSGDPDAVEYLHARMYLQLALYLMNKWELEEEEARSLSNLVVFEASRKVGGFRGESTLKTWIFTLAKNKAIDLLRKRFRGAGAEKEPRDALDDPAIIRLDDPAQEGKYPEPSATGPDEGEVEVTEKKRLALRALLSIPKRGRRILLKSEYLSDKELAAEFKVRKETIRSWRFRAKKQLEKAHDRVCKEVVNERR